MRTQSHIWTWAGTALAVIVLTVAGWWTRPWWLPQAQELIRLAAEPPAKKTDSHDGHDHSGHDHSGHDHSGHDHAHDDANALELSPEARLNIGLTKEMIGTVKREQFYYKKIAIPAMVVGLPGKTNTKVVAPMSGVVTDLFVIEGESIEPGSPMFKLRLLHEDLVKAETDYLRTLGSLDVEEKEIQRISGLTNNGAIAGKVLLDHQYEKHKLESVLKAQHEALLLHGLSKEQVERIKQSRQLVSEVVVRAPDIKPDSNALELVTQPVKKVKPRYVVKKLMVSKGDFLQAGGTMCVLSNYGDLYIQGRAFEQDVDDLAKATQYRWPVEALPENHQKHAKPIQDLRIAYLDHEVDTDSRAFHFYVDLPNSILSERTAENDHRYVTWKYKPGQRMQVFVPVATWENRIILPVDAVVKEGAEYFVFVENGSHFDRKPVYVEYKDQQNVVLGEDTFLFPGTRVALTGAHQMQVALKNKAGGGVDPHAGHNH